MAFDPVPTDVFASWSENGTTISLPIASVPQLTAAEADAVTGDSRKIVFALCEQFYQWYSALASEDAPTQLTVQKSVTPLSGGSQLNIQYIIQCTNDVLTQEVADES